MRKKDSSLQAYTGLCVDCVCTYSPVTLKTDKATDMIRHGWLREVTNIVQCAEKNALEKDLTLLAPKIL